MNDDLPTITITQSELYMLLGEAALPPFPGHPEADSWDCAPMASHVIEIVEKRFAGRWNEVSV